MSAPLAGLLFSLFLFIGILLLIEIGRRIGSRRFANEGESASKGVASVVGAVFGLMGLVLAFLFSGALSRFDDRRALIVEEANNIGTAWLRIDLLPPADQPAMRDAFRRYLDARLEAYSKLPDFGAAMLASGQAKAIQGEIWTLATQATRQPGAAHAPMLLLPALNAMFDIATTRLERVNMHPPLVIFGMLSVFALSCSLFTGYEMGFRKRLNLLHSGAFALVLSVTVYVIVDLEYPRLGLIRVDDADEILRQLRFDLNAAD